MIADKAKHLQPGDVAVLLGATKSLWYLIQTDHVIACVGYLPTTQALGSKGLHWLNCDDNPDPYRGKAALNVGPITFISAVDQRCFCIYYQGMVGWLWGTKQDCTDDPCWHIVQ